MLPVHNCELDKEDNVFPPLPKGSPLKQRLKRFILKLIVVSEKNPRSRQYLKSKAALTFEKRRHCQSKNWYVMHPFSAFRIAWEMFMVVILFGALTLLPYGIAFYKMSHLIDDTVYVSFRLFFDVVCLVDVGINFYTGYLEENTGEIVLDPRRIAAQYLGGLCLIDIISSVPLQFIVFSCLETSKNFQNKYYTLIEVLSLTKIFRANLLLKYTKQIFEIIVPELIYLPFLQLLIIAFLYIHWAACMHLLVPTFMYGSFKALKESEPNSWIISSGIYKELNIKQYQQCIFRAVSNIYSIGYGEFIPSSVQEEILCMMNIITGALFLAYLTVVLLQMNAWSYASRTKYQVKLNQLLEFMRHKQLPMHLQSRIISYYEYRFQKTYFNEHMIMATLSNRLRNEIVIHGCQRLVKNVPIFVNLPSAIMSAIITCLRPEVFLANDVIIKAGSQGDSMFFISSGTVAVLTSTGKEVTHLEDGCYFGEIALITRDERRVTSILAIETCELYRLYRRDFLRIFKQHSNLYIAIERIAMERMKLLSELEEKHKLPIKH